MRNLSLIPLLSALAVASQAQSVLIPVPTAREHVFDATRNYLYITTSTGRLERYSLGTGQLLAPFPVGASLNGADITPDGKYLYVAEGLRGATQGLFRKVNLDTGARTNIAYDLDGSEGGAWDIKIAANGRAFATTQYEGSGSSPLREIDLATDVLTVAAGAPHQADVNENTHINRSADGNYMLFAESNLSSGPLFTYNALTDSFSGKTNSGSERTNAVSAVNRDGTLMSIASGLGIRLLDSDLNTVGMLPQLAGGHIFDPVRDVLYAVRTTTDELVAVSTVTFQELFRLDIGEDIGTSRPMGPGEMSISPDGSTLALSTSTGVRIVSVPEPCSLCMLACLFAARRRTAACIAKRTWGGSSKSRRP